MVPLRVICDRCGAVLYEGMEIKAPNEIISDYDGKCPNCGKKLSDMPKMVEIKPIDEIKQPNRLRKKK
jgi:DNA-directed RNA polymerase subunit RPC12/RpoP